MVAFPTLVALRAKGGELTALRALSHPEQVRQVQPLLQFDPQASAPASQLDAVEVVIRDLRRLGRHVMLDASEVADLPAFGTGPTGALGQMTDRLADPVDLLDGPDPIAFIPVVRSDAAEQPAVALGRLCHELGAGCAFRVRSATAGRDNIERIIERLDLDTDRIDHVAMKYTCPDHWLYSRERMPEPDDRAADSPRAGAFRIVCRRLIESDNFAGPGFSWGDREIHEAATGRGRGFGDSSKPVALAISHHLAYLAGRSAA